MSFDAEALYRLLPAVLRLRDDAVGKQLGGVLGLAEAQTLKALKALPGPTPTEAEQLAALEEKAGRSLLTPDEVIELDGLAKANPTDEQQQLRIAALREKGGRGPLKALLTAFAREIAVVEENLEQIYDDLFIETCADWVVPYIGDLIGSEPLNGLGGGRGASRALVAHEIALRRRKGTAAVLEQLARDLTRWNARAVEFFQLLATRQYMNHIRKGNLVTPDIRDGDTLQWLGSAFDSIPRLVEVRRIASRRGRYNIPNVGIFLWRVDAHRLRQSPSVAETDDPGNLHFRISPLGNDTPLYTSPEAEDEITHLAEPINVPVPISRRTLHRDLSTFPKTGRSLYYGPDKSLQLYRGNVEVPIADVEVCNLSDLGAGWAHEAPAGKFAVDPELGRIAASSPPDRLHCTYHYGAFGNLGGGEYAAARTESPPGPHLKIQGGGVQLQTALDSLGGRGVVEILDNEIYEENVGITVGANGTIELRAAGGRRPTIKLTKPLELRGGAGSRIVISGVVIAGDQLTVPEANNDLRHLRLVHTTLVPGRALKPDGSPDQTGAESLTVERAGFEVAIERSVVGALRVHEGSEATVTDSIVDAGSLESPAFGPSAPMAATGGTLSIEASTFIGTVLCRLLEASNSILLGRVSVERRQEGCVRFTYVAPKSLTPRRFLCQPSSGPAGANHPSFTSLRYGHPSYCQLSSRTPAAIRSGADDESEMGAFHHLYQPQLESNLSSRLNEYLRVGLEAGAFYES